MKKKESKTMIDMIIQIGILATGVPAIYLLNTGRKFGSLIGLVGQIFWFAMAIRTQQWGVFALCVLYTYSWACGVKAWLNSISSEKRH